MNKLCMIVLSVAVVFSAQNLCAQEPAITQVCIKEHCFDVELALTLQEHARGLQHRESLAQDAGMLFIFDGFETYGFWMKNTLIPLDMIWIDADKNIVSITQNAQPCQETLCPTFLPEKKVKYVLEINGGLSLALGFDDGDQVVLK